MRVVYGTSRNLHINSDETFPNPNYLQRLQQDLIVTGGGIVGQHGINLTTHSMQFNVFYLAHTHGSEAKAKIFFGLFCFSFYLFTDHIRSMGKVMFSQACVILFAGGVLLEGALRGDPPPRRYGQTAVGTHPTGVQYCWLSFPLSVGVNRPLDIITTPRQSMKTLT